MIKAQINYCRFVFRILNILEKCDLVRPAELKQKVRFLMSKNIEIKMNKLTEMVNGKNTLFLEEF